MIIENTLLTASQICTLFILMGVGALCRRLNILTDKAVESLVKLLVNIVTPALIIDAFQCPFQSELLGDLAITAAISAIFHILLILLCTALFPGRDDSNPVIRMASVFSNAGFMGLPLEYAILGKAGVFFGSVYIASFNCFIWTWGIATLQDKTKSSLRPIFVNPGCIGLTIGLSLFFSSCTIPKPIAEPLYALSSLNTPLAMLAVGYNLGSVKPAIIAKSAAFYFAAAIRLVLSPLLMIGLICITRPLINIGRPASIALVIAAAAPVAALVAVLSAKYKKNMPLATGLVSGTTLLSIVTLPPAVAAAMYIFK